MLMTPGNRPERLLKALAGRSDAVVCDLEDGVPPEAKSTARESLRQALMAGPRGLVERCVRINALSSGLAEDDLRALPFEALDSIMVPKVESPEELRELERLLQAFGADRDRAQPLELVPTLETPRGVLRALAIAEASPRASGLFFGSGDYTAATGARVCAATLLYPRSVVTAAAAAAGVQAIDAAYFADVRDAEATREDALAARELGFAGKVVFHPAQVETVNEVFTPTSAELEHARLLVAAYEAARSRGAGTALAGSTFVAIDLVRPAQQLLARAVRIASREAAIAARPVRAVAPPEEKT